MKRRRHAQSLKEPCRTTSWINYNSSTVITPGTSTGVTRSQSFLGLMSGNRAVPLSPVTSTGPPVLGESFRNPKMLHHKDEGVSFSRKNGAKLPKVPRPARTMLMFECVKRGIR